jgi:hypothetical protein
MVVAFKIGDFVAHEPPYTEEEEHRFYKQMAAPPVAMTSITRSDITVSPAERSERQAAYAARVICRFAEELANLTGPFRDLRGALDPNALSKTPK